MSQVIFAPEAVLDLKRLREFLRPKNALSAKRAAVAITNAVQILGQHPKVGRPSDNMADEYRELLIEFGDSGYIALYQFDDDLVTILALRHQKEIGY